MSKKKIIVLSSTGGGGHIAATNALMEQLGEHYFVQPIFPLKTFLSPSNISLALSLGRWDGEYTYNYLIRKGHVRLINFIARFGCAYFSFMHRQAIGRMKKCLEEQKPDLVISVIPLINSITLEACKQLSIPYLVVPTDLNATLYLCNLKKPTYKKFLFTIPFEDEKIRAILQPAHIPNDQIRVTGCVIRQGFFVSKTDSQKEQIKKEFEVAPNKPVLLLLMGAQGSDILMQFVVELIKISCAAHLIICIGRNIELLSEINVLPFPAHISYSIVRYTDRIPDLMAVSDIFITKPGPNSIIEAIYSNLPILVDCTHAALE